VPSNPARRFSDFAASFLARRFWNASTIGPIVQ
jgi:hypothetical protein